MRPDLLFDSPYLPKNPPKKYTFKIKPWNSNIFSTSNLKLFHYEMTDQEDLLTVLRKYLIMLNSVNSF